MDDGQTGLELEALPSCAGEANGVTVRGPKTAIHIPDYGEVDTDDLDGDGGMLTEDELADAQEVASAIDKPSDPKRWIILVLATLAIFGPYYVFDNPAGTQQTVRNWQSSFGRDEDPGQAPLNSPKPWSTPLSL
jgi:hypothetical protein